MASFIGYLFYPLVAVLTLGAAWHQASSAHDLQWLFTGFAGARFLAFLLAEWRFPARPEWSMSWPSFIRDLKYMAAGALVAHLSKFFAGWISIGAAKHAAGPLSEIPIAAQVVLAVLAYEFVQYWIHRASHEAPGRFGHFLWRIHAVHHLPSGVYFLMHPVMHPINAVVAILLGLIPAYLLGASAEAVFMFNVLLGLQGSFSHFNAPVKAGPLNYLLVGTELHRLHHSARLDQARNFGVLTPVWDLVFGTYVRCSADMPERLGVADPDRYPESSQFWACFWLPFRSEKLTARKGRKAARPPV
jgi:sterol desaturase/sphingolipid hydroxylase (fatty acid hydroxylase superfamily)